MKSSFTQRQVQHHIKRWRERIVVEWSARYRVRAEAELEHLERLVSRGYQNGPAALRCWDVLFTLLGARDIYAEGTAGRAAWGRGKEKAEALLGEAA